MLRIQGCASRADIARQLSVTPATITRLVAALAEKSIVFEVEETGHTGRQEVGRPGKSIALNPNGAFFLGAEIGVGIIRCVLLDLSVSVVDSFESFITTQISPENTVKIISGYLSKLQKNPRFKGKILSLCVTVPGPVASNGYIIDLPQLGWKNIELFSLFAATGIPCFTENNTDAAAFGSVYARNNTPAICTIYLKVGSGCGGAVIINGKLLRGPNGTACEVGHIPINEKGPVCHHGHTGCLEGLINVDALARLLNRSGLTDSQLAELPDAAVDMAKKGDKTAARAIDTIIRYSSRGIIALVNIFSPTLIILGGSMRPVFEYSLERVAQGISGGLVPGIAVPEIQLSQLGLFECAIGAASIAHHKAFDLSNIDLTGI